MRASHLPTNHDAVLDGFLVVGLYAPPAEWSPTPSLMHRTALVSTTNQSHCDGCSHSADFEKHLLNFEPNKETVLIVTHEVSRSDSAILVQRIGAALRQQYNVIVLTLQGGTLRNEIIAAGRLVLGPLSEEQRSPGFLTQLVAEIARRTPVKFAIVNSIQSSIALSALWENDIANVHLIHELAGETRPKGQFRISALFSGERIFPSKLVRDAATAETPDETSKPGLILPHNICVPHGNVVSATADVTERKQIHSNLPASFPQDELCFKSFIERLDTVARQCASKKEQEKVDRFVISKSNLFDVDFFRSPLGEVKQDDPVKSYVSAFSSGIAPRKARRDFIPQLIKSTMTLMDVIHWRIISTVAARQGLGTSRLFALGKLPML